MLTDEEIAQGRHRLPYSPATLHEHPDCIRLAYEWLDAQRTVKTSSKRYLPLKHIIEKWAGRYVSQSDVEVAAILHPNISGKYPNFNISRRLTLPNDRRLDGIGEALSQERYRPQLREETYAIVES